MRITNLMTHNNTMSSLNKNSNNINKYTTQLLTNKKINRPSDDAISITSVLSSRRELSYLDQYSKNISTANSQLNVAEGVLDEINSILMRCSELAIQGANDVYDSTSRQAIADEVKQLREQLGNLANTKFGDYYIFGGTDINNAPYDTENEKWVANIDANTKVEIEISSGVYAQINVDGEELFNGAGVSKDMFGVLSNLENALLNNDTSYISESSIKDIKDCINQNVRSLSKVGSIMNKIDVVESKNTDLSVNTQEDLSNKEDVDVAEIYVKLSAAKTAYQSGISVASNILQVSLLDYLK